MLDRGTYKARAYDAALGVSSKGTEQIAVAFRVTEGDYAGQSITYYGFFSEKTVDRTLESLRHMGWTGDDLTSLDGIDANEVEIVVDHEEDQQGEMRARVRWVNKPGSGLAMKERMSPQAAKAFAAKMKAKAIKSRANGGAQPQRTTQQAAQFNDDEPPPF